MANPWESVSITEAPGLVPRGYAGAEEAVSWAGNPTADEVILAMKATGIDRYFNPMRDTLRRTVGDVFNTVNGRHRAVLDGMTALVDAIIGEQIDFSTARWGEPPVDVVRRDLVKWLAERRADAEADGDPSHWDIDAAAALADRPPILLVAATINRIADDIRAEAFNYIGSFADGDGSSIADASKRISAEAWRRSANLWVAARA